MASIFTKLVTPIRFCSKILSQPSKPPLINFNLTNVKFVSTTFPIRIQENISSLQLKKRPTRKKKLYEEGIQKEPGEYTAVAFATAEEFRLEKLVEGLRVQNLYEPRVIDTLPDVVHAVAKYQVDTEPREIFFFREGSVVLWNITDLESSNVLAFIKQYEQDSYSERVIQGESEVMTYSYAPSGSHSKLQTDGKIILSNDEQSVLEKYAFSNAMGLSVKLGVWESSLERYIDTIEFVTEDLKRGTKIKMSREEVLRKHGELFALRHLINLSSDLLDTPDFYWDREHLESIYSQTSSYFSVNRRTKVMNEKLNHCVELIELLSSHLSDRHHIRLEWMIIILIMVEVAFEFIHYVDRYFG
ncbi:uncharacterized protein CBL_12927 [Carabus blaptoides fortunei]